ncbi:unnamed protein product [Brachionus calyciflorus]|uniref:Tc1-like transposase DDE domain-containing protein n=1 Tax=Brachionus calyciflorus TaxID=104777 RepID=A0A814FKX8_9BILA|nr:unnamed protein product [Brachionus calyciflorus]
MPNPSKRSKAGSSNYVIKIEINPPPNKPNNATTHTNQVYDLSLMGKSKGTNCPYEKIEWIEDGKKVSVDCFFENGRRKGLFFLAKELGIIPFSTISKSFNIEQLRQTMAKHPAFDKKTKLEQLAEKYKIKIIFVPKYHCEFNPIEAFWCFSKNYVRKNNEQKFDQLNNLIITSLFRRSFLTAKISNRFWNCLDMFQSGSTYENILQFNVLFLVLLFFS